MKKIYEDKYIEYLKNRINVIDRNIHDLGVYDADREMINLRYSRDAVYHCLKAFEMYRDSIYIERDRIDG